MKKNKGTVYVGLSGGVDSSVSALRLQEEGYTVVGVFIEVWTPNFIECDQEKDRLDAMRVAAHLNIPFLVCDAKEAYREGVALYMVREYEAGRTPNPDVMCNDVVKFGVFYDFAMKQGADYIATGHYAQHIQKDGVSHLCRGIDESKDQSYFLYRIGGEALSKTLFPIGGLQKKKVREIAKKHGLLTADKRDSQGICFLGAIDMKSFLEHYLEEREGNVLNSKGEVIGTHDGAYFYTIGQRHGFKIHTKHAAHEPHYVTQKNIETNELTVDTTYPKVHTCDVVVGGLSWIGEKPHVGEEYMLQTRYRQTPSKAAVISLHEDIMKLSIVEEVEKPSSGQSAVLYTHKGVCLGGGIIH